MHHSAKLFIRKINAKHFIFCSSKSESKDVVIASLVAVLNLYLQYLQFTHHKTIIVLNI